MSTKSQHDIVNDTCQGPKRLLNVYVSKKAGLTDTISPSAHKKMPNWPDLERFLTISCHLAYNSVRLVFWRLKIFEKWRLNRPLTKKLIEEFLFYLKNKGLKNNSINCYIFAFNFYHKYLLERKIKCQDFRIDHLPKVKPIIEILSVEEIESIINTNLNYNVVKFTGNSKPRLYPWPQLNNTYKAMIRFLAVTGCRYAEAQQLRVKDIDFGNGKVIFRETKNKEWRQVYILPPLIDELKFLTREKTRDEYVFTNSRNREIHPTDFGDDLHRRAKLAGVTKRVHPHLFRHSLATHLLSSGADVTKVATILGHKDIQTTFSSYVHLADEQIRQTMYLLPLNRKHMPVSEIFIIIKNMIEGLKINEDERIKYSFQQSNRSLKIQLSNLNH